MNECSRLQKLFLSLALSRPSHKCTLAPDAQEQSKLWAQSNTLRCDADASGKTPNTARLECIRNTDKTWNYSDDFLPLSVMSFIYSLQPVVTGRVGRVRNIFNKTTGFVFAILGLVELHQSHCVASFVSCARLATSDRWMHPKTNRNQKKKMKTKSHAQLFDFRCLGIREKETANAAVHMIICIVHTRENINFGSVGRNATTNRNRSGKRFRVRTSEMPLHLCCDNAR